MNTNGRMNLMILTPGFPGSEKESVPVTSIQQYIHSLKSYYPESDIRVAAFQYPFRRGEYDWNGIKVYSAGGRNSRLFKIITWLKILAYLHFEHRRKKIDIIHAFWLGEASLLALIINRVTGIPFVAAAMGQDIRKTNPCLYLLRLFKVNVVTLSEFMTGYLGKYSKIRIIRKIPFGTRDSDNPVPAGNRNTDILGVGSLNKVKNFGEFVEIIARLTKRYPSLNCLIIGKGKEETGLRKKVCLYQMEDRIKFMGEIDHEEVRQKMTSSRILLHTSLFEGQGMVITEALASGMTVVCHPVGIATEISSDKLFTGKNTAEMVNILERVLKDPGQDYRPFAYYSMKQTCESYMTVYREILSSGQSSISD